MIIAIIVLAIVLIGLLVRPKRAAPTPVDTGLRRDGEDVLIYGQTPNGHWEGGNLPADFTPGGGDFGGAGASGSWDSGNDSGSSGSND